MAGHQRSTSWPATMAHPNKTDIQEALQSIASTSTPAAGTIEAVCDGLRRLGDVYSHIDEAICLLSNHTQLAVHGRKNKRLEEEMERSLQVLDLCGALQESFGDLKMTVQELQMGLNLHRGDLPVAQTKAQAYGRLVKKAKHQLKKAAGGSKSSSTSTSSAAAAAHEDAWLVGLLATARGITVAALRSAVELLATTCGASKWSSLVTRSVQKKRVSCEEVQLQALELGIVSLESSVEKLFRCLIQTRVSLLNALSL